MLLQISSSVPSQPIPETTNAQKTWSKQAMPNSVPINHQGQNIKSPNESICSGATGSSSTTTSKLQNNYGANYKRQIPKKKNHFQGNNNQRKHQNYASNSSYNHGHKQHYYHQHADNRQSYYRSNNSNKNQHTLSSYHQQQYQQNHHQFNKHQNHSSYHGNSGAYGQVSGNYQKNQTNGGRYHHYKQRQFGNQIQGANGFMNQINYSGMAQTQFYGVDNYLHNYVQNLQVQQDLTNDSSATTADLLTFQSQHHMLAPFQGVNSTNNVIQSSPSLDWINEQNRLQSKQLSLLNKDCAQNSIRNIESNNMECNSESGGATTTSVSSRSKDEKLLGKFTEIDESLKQPPLDQIFGSFSSQIVDLQGQESKKAVLCQGTVQVPSGSIEVTLRQGDQLDEVINRFIQHANFQPNMETPMQMALKTYFQRMIDQATTETSQETKENDSSNAIHQDTDYPVAYDQQQNNYQQQHNEFDRIIDYEEHQDDSKVFNQLSMPFYPQQIQIQHYDDMGNYPSHHQ